MRINLQRHTEHQSGYGRFGVEMERALARCGVENAGDIGLEPHGQQGRSAAERTVPVAIAGDTELCHVALWLSTPPHVRGWYEGQFAAIFTMWESSQIPASFRENLHNFDRVFVPSMQNVELFSRYHPDVKLVPLGLDPEAWHRTPRQPIERDFRFFSAGYGPRKGCRQVADAFLRVFPGGKPPTPMEPIPRLILKSRDDISGPGITMIGQQLSAASEVDLYANVHCYVSGSKGEGWGLMPFQAMGQGCPTILGDAHGHHQFAQYASFRLDTHPVDASKGTFWGDGGEWWEPDFDQMCEAMWEMYQNYDQYAKEAAVSADTLGRVYTWDHAAEALLWGLNGELFEDPPTAATWRAATPHLFPFRVNKDCSYSINGQMHAFTPGVEYWEAADLLRAVMASGHLDWSTFDPDSLGREDDVDLARLRALNSICPTCHNPYNRDDTLRDLVGAL